jgi:alkylation response protein AidB-like acyl-CoA dehydrogenase
MARQRRRGHVEERSEKRLGHREALGTVLGARVGLGSGHGRALIDDPLVRQKLGRIWADLEVERYGALRTLTMLEGGEHPGAGGSLTKLSYSELEKRFKIQVDLKDDPQLKRGEMKILSDKKHDLTKQVVGAVPGT